MEEKIMDMLNNLDIKETDKLLDTNIAMPIDSATMKRIKKSVYKKAEVKASKNIIIRKGLTIAAAVLLFVMLSTVTIGVDNVAAAFGKLFSFIPGYGIIENNQTIEYIADGKNLRAENDYAIINVNTVIATKDSISISFELERKNFDESNIMDQKQKQMEKLKNGGELGKPNFSIFANGKQYKTSGYSIGSGGKYDSVCADFKIDSEYINSQTAYKLEYKDYNLVLDFKLTPYDSFDSLEEIGPTSTRNNISITAIANWNNNKLEVGLYPINKTEYTIKSFTRDNNGYEEKDLNLKTSNGIQKYSTPDSSMGINNKFYFDVSSNAKDLVVNIPYLRVQSNERQNISLEIPKNGEKLTVNIKVEFNDCTMIITSVEKVNTNDNVFGALRMNFHYENKSKDMVMRSVQLYRTDWKGMTKGGGYSFATDKNDIFESIDYFLIEGEDDVLRLKLENPEYYLLGEYNLKIK